MNNVEKVLECLAKRKEKSANKDKSMTLFEELESAKNEIARLDNILSFRDEENEKLLAIRDANEMEISTLLGKYDEQCAANSKLQKTIEDLKINVDELLEENECLKSDIYDKNEELELIKKRSNDKSVVIIDLKEEIRLANLKMRILTDIWNHLEEQVEKLKIGESSEDKIIDNKAAEIRIIRNF